MVYRNPRDRLDFLREKGYWLELARVTKVGNKHLLKSGLP